MLDPLPPVPDGVLFEAAVHDPDAMWSRLQRGAGGALALLPPTLGELASGLLGVDAGLGALVDGHATSYALVAQRSGAWDGDSGPGWVLALRLTEDGARRVASRSFDGGESGWSERVQGGLRVLTRPEAPLPLALALAPGWLVVARDEPGLVAMAPYVYRTMPGEAALVGTALVGIAPHAALAGPVAGYLASQWAAARAWLLERDRSERARHGGRAPDFGDPEALVAAAAPAFERRLASLAAARGFRVEVEAGDDDLTVEVRAASSLAGTIDAGLAIAPRVGDAHPLIDVPASASLRALRARRTRGACRRRARPHGPAGPVSRLAPDGRAGACDREAALGGVGRRAGGTGCRSRSGRLGLERKRGAGAGSGAGVGRRRGRRRRLGRRLERLGLGLGRGRGRGPRDRRPCGSGRLPRTSEAVLRAVRGVIDVARFSRRCERSRATCFPRAPSCSRRASGTFCRSRRSSRRSRSGRRGPVARRRRRRGRGGVVRRRRRRDHRRGAGSARASGRGNVCRRHLGQDARTARALSAVGDSASFVALARPMGFGDQVAAATGTAGPGGTAALEGARAGGRGARGAPVLVAWGRRGGDPGARIDPFADELLTEGVRLGASLF